MSTKDQQTREIVEGLGIGLLTLDVRHVSSTKVTLELAFAHAWRTWPHADAYPSIGRAPKPDNVFWLGVQKSARRQHSTVVWIPNGDTYAIEVVHENWSTEEAARVISDRPLDDWALLATPFHARLTRNA